MCDTEVHQRDGEQGGEEGGGLRGDGYSLVQADLRDAQAVEVISLY